LFLNGYDDLGLDRGIITDTEDTLTPNWPVITDVVPLSGTSLVRGLASGTFLLHSGQVELYSLAPDPSGHGEWRAYLGTVPTDANGVWLITVPAAAGRCFTAFETDYGFIALDSHYWYSTEFGPNSCTYLFLPLVRK
jgi:hypothetical protein